MGAARSDDGSLKGFFRGFHIKCRMICCCVKWVAVVNLSLQPAQWFHIVGYLLFDSKDTRLRQGRLPARRRPQVVGFRQKGFQAFLHYSKCFKQGQGRTKWCIKFPKSFWIQQMIWGEQCSSFHNCFCIFFISCQTLGYSAAIRFVAIYCLVERPDSISRYCMVDATFIWRKNSAWCR